MGNGEDAKDSAEAEYADTDEAYDEDEDEADDDDDVEETGDEGWMRIMRRGMWPLITYLVLNTLLLYY